METTATTPSRRTSALCLVTATTTDFLPGTIVTIGSFLKHHPGFDGEVVIIEDGLCEEHRELLRTLHGCVRLVPVSSELQARIARLTAAHPDIKDRAARFFAIEALRLTGYRKVLFCDSDLLFRAPVEELFDTDEALLCCGDRAVLEDMHRDAATFLRMQPESGEDAAAVLERTFNSGFLVMDAGVVGKRTYGKLLAMLTPDVWRGIGTPHTAQVLLNRCFAGRQTLISSTYNYLLASAPAIRSREGLEVADAKVLHFNVPGKPWMPLRLLRWTRDVKPVPGLLLWWEAWADCLSTLHLSTGDFFKGE